MAFKTQIRLIRRKEVIQLTGLSKSSLYNRINDGLMPSSISLGDRAVAFVEEEIQTILLAMIAGQTREQIKTLVQELIVNRKTSIGGNSL